MKFESTSFWINCIFHIVIVLVSLEVFGQLIKVPCAEANSSQDDDLTLTYSQKVTLDKFKERMRSKLPHDYMKSDIYLVRWLRVKKFNMDEAERMLNDDLKWRRDNKIDQILQEDTRFVREKFPYYLDSFAKNGEPILTVSFADWNVREAALTGRMPELLRQFSRGFEEAATLIRKMQSEGKQVTQFHFIVNLERYSIITHGCLSCMPFYFAITDTSKYHYPGLLRSLIAINTPPSFEMILQAIRPAFSPRIRGIMKVYGQDKSTWRKALLEIANENQLSRDFGGTFVRQSE